MGRTTIPAGTFKRAWQLTKTSLWVLRKDKEMLAYPLLAGLIILPLSLYLAILVLPTAFDGNMGNPLIALVLLFFVIYIIGTVVMTFFNVAMVASASKRMDGGNPTIGYSLGFAARRIKYILMWGLFAGAIGFFLSLLSGSKNGGARLIGFLGQIGWSVAKYFAVPVITFNDAGPIKAIKKSTEVLTKSWGTALVSNLGIGVLFFLMVFAVVFITPLVEVSLMVAGADLLVLPVLILALTIIIVLAMIYIIVNVILMTALYRYGTTGKVSPEFHESFIRDPFNVGRVDAGVTTTLAGGEMDYDTQLRVRREMGGNRM